LEVEEGRKEGRKKGRKEGKKERRTPLATDRMEFVKEGRNE
jgi:hypothetical protein